jgi:hypothetical protein
LVSYLEATGNGVVLARFKALSNWCLKVFQTFEPNGVMGLNSGLAFEDSRKYIEFYSSDLGFFKMRDALRTLLDFTGIMKPAADRLIFKKFKTVTAEEMDEYFGIWSRIQANLKKVFTTALRWNSSQAFQFASLFSGKINQKFNGYFHKLSLGKLSLILEPAGKVRVVAIVDWWTQTALIPMHEWLSETLEKRFRGDRRYI